MMCWASINSRTEAQETSGRLQISALFRHDHARNPQAVSLEAFATSKSWPHLTSLGRSFRIREKGQFYAQHSTLSFRALGGDRPSMREADRPNNG